MKKYNQIMQEIAKLEREAAKARNEEIKSVIQQIKRLMAEYGITLADLRGTRGPGRKPRKGKAVATARKTSAKKGRKATVKAKYRSAENSKLTWSGRGRKPKWVQEWVDAGNQLDDLRID